MSREPVYSAFIDWHGHGGLASGLSGWHTRAGTNPTVAELTTAQSYIGGESIKITNPVDFNMPQVGRSYLIPANVETTISVWVYVTGTGGNGTLSAFTATATLGSTNTALKNQWVELSLTINEPNDVEVSVIVNMTHTTDTNDAIYIGWSHLRTDDDDVSCYVLATRQVPSIVYGRDTASDLSTIRTGEVSLDLNNVDGRFTPNNNVVSFGSRIGPSKQVLLMAEFEDARYILYNGYTDGFKVNAHVNQKSISFSCIDLLTKLAETPIHTELYPSIRTGDAVEAVIEAAGLYDTLRRDVVVSGDWEVIQPYTDSGATTLTWWTYSGDAKAGLDRLLEAEGPPSLYGVGISNQIVFRDRHHRLRADYLARPVKTLVTCDDGSLDSDEYVVKDNYEIDYGWSTFYNKVSGTTTLRSPADEISVVWTDPVTQRTISGRTVIEADTEGYLEGQKPIAGKRVLTNNPGPDDETNIYVAITPDSPDFIVERGTVTVESWTTSGTHVEIVLVAAGTAMISGLQFRGRAIKSDDAAFTVEDTASQVFYRTVKTQDLQAGDASPSDSDSLARLLLKNNASPRPTVTMTVQNRDERHTEMILGTDLSETMHLPVPEWNVDNDFTVEAIEHTAGQLGFDHTMKLTMQQATSDGYETNLLQFDTDGHGFDVAVFSQFSAYSFTFGDAEQGFGDGAFGLQAKTNVPFILGTSTLNSTDELWY